jgi:hypothetical protein
MFAFGADGGGGIAIFAYPSGLNGLTSPESAQTPSTTKESAQRPCSAPFRADLCYEAE